MQDKPTIASVPSKLVSGFRWIESIGMNNIVITACHDQAMWKFLIRRQNTHSWHKTIVST